MVQQSGAGSGALEAAAALAAAERVGLAAELAAVGVVEFARREAARRRRAVAEQVRDGWAHLTIWHAAERCGDRPDVRALRAAVDEACAGRTSTCTHGPSYTAVAVRGPQARTVLEQLVATARGLHPGWRVEFALP